MLLLSVVVAWFWPKSEQTWHWVVLSDEQGMLAQRDQTIRSAIKRDWFRWQDSGRLHITYIDSSQSQAVLEQTLVAIENQQRIDVLLGCGDSVCLRKVLPWLQENQRLLLYPASSEGLMAGDVVVHLGLMANQLLQPVLHWLQSQPIRDVILVGSNSARSSMLFRMLETHESWQFKPISFTTLLLDYPSQFSELDDLVLERMPDVLVLDVCEWIDQPSRLQALSALPIPKVSLCVDQPIDRMVGMYVVQQLAANKDPHAIAKSSPLERNMHWLNTQLIVAAKQGAIKDTATLRTFFGLRTGETAAGGVVVDRELRGSWQSVALLYQQQPQHIRRIWQSESAVRPHMFPSSDSPSTWLHDLTIYWRNAGGYWRTAQVEE